MFKKLRLKNRRRIMPMLKKNLLSRKAIITSIIVIVLVSCAILIRNYFCNATLFTIKEIELKGEGIADSYLFERLSHIGVGENIFAINIRHIASSIKDDYFEIKDIRVERVFPNKLIFYIEKRETVALVSSGYYYPVDKEGVVLKDVSRTMQERLPVIKGIYLHSKDIGKKHKSPKLTKSLRLLEELSKSNIIESHNISEIDAADSSNISFYIDDGLQIKIGGENFMQRLELLKKTLEDPGISPREINYIDLRFKDIVIKPK